MPDLRSQTAQEALLKQAESRLRAIYDRAEFRPRRFQPEWLPDSSGYTVLESVPDAKEKVRARYDVASGQRTVLCNVCEKDEHLHRAEAKKYGFDYIEMDQELFGNVTEEVTKSLGLNASYRLTAVSRDKAQEEQNEK